MSEEKRGESQLAIETRVTKAAYRFLHSTWERHTHTLRYIWQEIFSFLLPPTLCPIHRQKKILFSSSSFFLREMFLSNQSPRTNSYRNCWLRHKHVPCSKWRCVSTWPWGMFRTRATSTKKKVKNKNKKQKQKTTFSLMFTCFLFFFFFFKFFLIGQFLAGCVESFKHGAFQLVVIISFFGVVSNIVDPLANVDDDEKKRTKLSS